MASSASSSALRTREELARNKALDEARKSGVLPPAVDNEGNMLNPHVPEFVSQAPWYLNQHEGSGLKHQRMSQETAKSDLSSSWYARGKDVLVGDRKTRFERNACKNCGAKTHQAKDCMERPRKRGAWKTNANLASDEIVQERLKLSYDESRDRWNGVDAEVYMKKNMRLHEKAEQEKRIEAQRIRDEKFKRKEERRTERKKEKDAKKEAKKAKKEENRKLKKDQNSGGSESDSDSDSDSDSESDLDSDSDSDKDDGVRQLGNESTAFKVGNKVKASVHNLRIREDTAKYLLNLDVNSAFYDPKTRSMRANPNPELDATQADYVGDNFVKNSGDAVELAKAQIFAWDASARQSHDGEDPNALHLQGNPTQVALAQKQFEERKRKAKEIRERSLKEKYGENVVMGKEADPSMLCAASSEFVEHTPDGRRIRQGITLTQSGPKYDEDVMEGNHTTVWGSYFDRESMRWGFQCCWQTSRRSYCTGEAGRRAKIAAIKHANGNFELTPSVKAEQDDAENEKSSSPSAQDSKEKISSEKSENKKSKKSKQSKHRSRHSDRDDSSEDDPSSDDSGSDSSRGKNHQSSRSKRKKNSSSSSSSKKNKRSKSKKRRHSRHRRRSYDSDSSSDSDSNSGSESEDKRINDRDRKRRRRHKQETRGGSPPAPRHRTSASNSSSRAEPNEAEMDSYYRAKSRDGDPMGK